MPSNNWKNSSSDNGSTADGPNATILKPNGPTRFGFGAGDEPRKAGLPRVVARVDNRRAIRFEPKAACASPIGIDYPSKATRRNRLMRPIAAVCTIGM
jgi:hypothetical protein